MKVKPGYKQTEVGVIPEEWGVVELGDLKPFVTSGSRGWATYYSERGSLFVRITNLSRDSIYLDLADSKFVKLPPEASEGVRTQLKEHDVLISITADIGIVGYVDGSLHSPAYINQHIALVRFEHAQATGKFVSYFLASDRPQRLFRTSTDVGAKAGMSLIAVQRIKTALPPLPEQRAIATALSDVDALLSGLDRLIAKKRDLKQAALQQLLTGQTRLPGFKGEWEVKRLGDVAAISMGQSPDSKNYNRIGDGVPLIQGNADIENRRSIARVWTTQITKEGRAGDLLLTVRAPVGAVGRVSERCCLGRGVCSIRPHEDSDFIFHSLVFAEPRWRLLEQGSTFTSANSTQVAAFSFGLPNNVAEQTAIAEVLTSMDDELAALEQRREKTRALKQAMMQELLTGRTRLV